MKESKILIYQLRRRKIADLSDQQLRINQKFSLHKRNLQLYYFYCFLLVYLDYSFFITVEHNHNMNASVLVYHTSVVGNGNVLIKFLFRFLLEIFSQLACALVRLPSEFPSVVKKGAPLSSLSNSLYSFLSWDTTRKSLPSRISSLEKKKEARYFLHARTCRNKGRPRKGRACHEGMLDSRGVAPQKWIQLNSHTRRARAETCRDALALVRGRKNAERDAWCNPRQTNKQMCLSTRPLANGTQRAGNFVDVRFEETKDSIYTLRLEIGAGEKKGCDGRESLAPRVEHKLTRNERET